MASVTRKLGGGCLAALLLGGGCLGYPVAKIRWSRYAVDAYCAEVNVGDPIAGLSQKARDRWLEVLELEPRKGQPAELMVWQGWVFARRFCDIEHEGGSVTKKRSSSLD